MPATKNALLRLKVLDELLAEGCDFKEYMSLGKLVSCVKQKLGKEVTDRCIQLDLKYIKDKLGAEIESNHAYGHRYADPTFSIFKREMSDEEKKILAQVLGVLGKIDGIPELRELNRLAAEANLPKQEKQPIVTFTTNLKVEDSTLFDRLFVAISRKQVIELHYSKYETPEQDDVHVVHPYQLKEYNRRWYLFGLDEKEDKIENFPLDRIRSFEPRADVAYREDDGRLAEHFEDIIGVTNYEDKPVQTITFWVSDRSKDFVATKPLHESQKHLRNAATVAELRGEHPELPAGGAFFSIDCKKNYELIRELMSFGPDLVVLSPKDIRDAITKKITEMSERYSWRT